MRSRVKIVMAATSLFLMLSVPAMANPAPPTNGGNGAGQSGQCTGAADLRPHGCHTWK